MVMIDGLGWPVGELVVHTARIIGEQLRGTKVTGSGITDPRQLLCVHAAESMRDKKTGYQNMEIDIGQSERDSPWRNRMVLHIDHATSMQLQCKVLADILCNPVLSLPHSPPPNRYKYVRWARTVTH